MKISYRDRKKTIEALLLQLPEAFEPSTRKRAVRGEELIKAGIQRDGKGRFVVAQKSYTMTEDIKVPVNHERRLSRIIDSAPSKESMIEALSAYVEKYRIKEEKSV